MAVPPATQKDNVKRDNNSGLLLGVIGLVLFLGVIGISISKLPFNSLISVICIVLAAGGFCFSLMGLVQSIRTVRHAPAGSIYTSAILGVFFSAVALVIGIIIIIII